MRKTTSARNNEDSDRGGSCFDHSAFCRFNLQVNVPKQLFSPRLNKLLNRFHTMIEKCKFE